MDRYVLFFPGIPLPSFFNTGDKFDEKEDIVNVYTEDDGIWRGNVSYK